MTQDSLRTDVKFCQEPMRAVLDTPPDSYNHMSPCAMISGPAGPDNRQYTETNPMWCSSLRARSMSEERHNRNPPLLDDLVARTQVHARFRNKGLLTYRRHPFHLSSRCTMKIMIPEEYQLRKYTHIPNHPPPLNARSFLAVG